MRMPPHSITWACLALFAVGVLVYFAREWASDRQTSRLFLEEEFLIPAVPGLKLGMEREDFLQLRNDRVAGFSAGAGQEAEGSPRLFAESASDGSRKRRAIYGFDGEPPLLQSLFYFDEYAKDQLDSEIEKKLRAATEAWGVPAEFYAEDMGGVEYFVVLWRETREGFAMAIGFAPPAARAANPNPPPAAAGYPVLTRYFPKDLPVDQTLHAMPNPRSFTVESERQRLLENAQAWVGNRPTNTGVGEPIGPQSATWPLNPPASTADLAVAGAS